MTKKKKECGCRADGLTRNVTVWTCAACGTVQTARKRRCAGCKRPKPKAPLGFGCCGATWHAHARCGRCERCPALTEMVLCADLHPELTHLAPEAERGSFTDRRGIRRCVGCLTEEIPSKPRGCVCTNGARCEHYDCACACACHSLAPYGYLSYL